MRAAVVGAVLAGLAFCVPALATPVATTPEQAQTYGRVFVEPIASVNFTQFAPPAGDREFEAGMALLAKLYPRYLKVTTVADAIGDALAVSTGYDAIPAGAPGDTGDGLPFDVLELTDTTVPDEGKAYAAVMFAHSAEACGREGVIRGVEDILRATADPSITFTDGAGQGGEHRLTGAELLRRTKIFVVSSSPDGWAAGDVTGRFDQSTGGGRNSNRVAWQKGWVFADKTLAEHGYKTATESEGLAVGRFFDEVRAKELHGRPFTVGADFHGPLPTALILEHDGGNTPAKLLRMPDLGARAQAALEKVFARYATEPGSAGYQQAAAAISQYRDQVRDNTPGLIDPVGGLSYGSSNGFGATVNTAGDYPLTWAVAAQTTDGIGYTASSTWGGFLSGEMGAETLTFEINCETSAPFTPATIQLYADNTRAGLFTVLVQAAAADRTPEQRDLGGAVGFYEDGARVTDKDGNPQPVPRGFPGSPLVQQLEQRPYDVSQTDYFRDVPQITEQTPRAVKPSKLRTTLPSLRTLVVADQQPTDTATLTSWVKDGGNLVLTDSALRLLPALGVGSAADVTKGAGYVGYADLVRDHPLVDGLSRYARQTFDPIGLGFPLLMQRDGYWQCPYGQVNCESGTKNSAPIWTVARSAITKVQGARIAGTADLPAATATREGTGTDRVEIATLPLGKGRVTIFGGLLPRPTEDYPHFFGLEGYTISPSGQEMLLRAMTWPAGAPAAKAARLTRRRLGGGRLRLRVLHPTAGTRSVRFSVGRRIVGTDRRAPFALTVRLRRAERRAARVVVSARLTPSKKVLRRTLARRAARSARNASAARAADTAGTVGPTPTVHDRSTDPAARAFVDAMLLHHRQGVTLARMALVLTRREAVRAVALRMLGEQRREIAYLEALRSAWGPARATTFVCPLGGDRHARRAMGIAGARALDALRRSRGRSADRRFVALMAAHHRGAIAMSDRARRATGQLDVDFLARGVLRNQTTELAMLRALRSSEGRAGALAGSVGI